MAKSINEINALNSLKQVQLVTEVNKPKRAGVTKRGKTAAGKATGKTAKRAGAGSTQRVRKTSNSATQRAAQKKAQRAAARNLFATDTHDTATAAAGGSVRAYNLATLAPLTTLAPGATLRVVPGRAPVLLYARNIVPQSIRASLPAGALPTSRNISIGQLYSALASTIGGAEAFKFCESLLQERWDAWMAAEKSWQEDEAENAKQSEEASIRSQQRAVEEKRVRASSQQQLKQALNAAHASLHEKHAAQQAIVTQRRLRSRSVPAPVRVAAAVAPASGVGSRVITTSVVDTLDSTPVPGLALTAPAEPTSRPTPASPQERGARQAKRLRQSADEMA